MVRFSLIIPAYNSRKYLSKLLDSILKQSFKNYEVIVVNDGSTDGTDSVVNKYKKCFENMVVVNIDNSGPGVARKIGFEHSSGEYLWFVDSDDFLYEDSALSYFNEIIEKNKVDMVLFGVCIDYGDKKKVANALYRKMKEGVYATKEIEDINVRSALWYKLFARRKIKDSYFTSSRNLEDCYFTYRYLNDCKCFYFGNRVCYVANRASENSLSKQNPLKKIVESVDVLKSTYSATKYKESLFFTVADYYTSMRRLISRSNLSRKDKTNLIKKTLELKEIIRENHSLLLRANLKIKLKYAYYSIGDYRYEK